MAQTDKELVSFRFEKTLKQQLAELAAATGRSQTFLAEEAIKQYCDLQGWQVSAIQEGIRAADAGEGISHDRLKRKWEKKFADLLDETR
ncbi:MAG: CopG family ribbon-helix-helix protein [Candidatus Micrarchaeaceae archaeon]